MREDVLLVVRPFAGFLVHRQRRHRLDQRECKGRKVVRGLPLLRLSCGVSCEGLSRGDRSANVIPVGANSRKPRKLQYWLKQVSRSQTGGGRRVKKDGALWKSGCWAVGLGENCRLERR